MAAGLVVPWWVGCQVVAHRSRFLYWRPVEDAVNERVNHDPDIGGWVAALGRDYVLVLPGRSGPQLFEPGRVTKFDDGGICYGAGRPLVLISPRYRHRPRFDQLQAALAADEVDLDTGWAAYSVHPDATARRVDLDTEFDFTGIARPFDPDTLLADPRIVCLLIAAADQPLPAQREQLEACTALVDEHLPVAVEVSGNDSGVLRSATVVSSPAR